MSNKDPLKKEYALLKALMDGRIPFMATVPKEMSAAETTRLGVTSRFFAEWS